MFIRVSFCLDSIYDKKEPVIASSPPKTIGDTNKEANKAEKYFNDFVTLIYYLNAHNKRNEYK